MKPNPQITDSVYWRWLSLALAFAAGVMSVAAFAPFSLFPAALVGPAVLFYIWRSCSPRLGFLTGLAYGLGLLGVGVFWMHISIDQFGNIGTPGAIALTLLFLAAMSLYYGGVGWLAAKWNRDPLALWLGFPALWVLGEWLRGWVLGGFPWLVLGYSQIDTPLAEYAPLVGVYGVSWVLLLSAGLVVSLFTQSGRSRWVSLLLLPVLWGGGYFLSAVSWTEDAGAPFRVSMVQGNVPQQIKWQPKQLDPTLDLYLNLTREHWQSDLIIWPETAVPAFAHLVEQRLLEPLAKEAEQNSSDVLVGIPIWQMSQKRYYNGLLQLTGGQIGGDYRKRHLVPFGEYMPFDQLFRPLLAWMNIPMSSFAAGPDEQPLLKLAGYPAGLSICYEDAFGNEINDALPEAAYLINVSNDAWFGDSLAPHQHLEIARMRALEAGRFLLRSTNTGISALIAPDGKIVRESPAFKQHVLSGEVVPKGGATPFVQWGNAPIVVLLSVFAFLFRRRALRS